MGERRFWEKIKNKPKGLMLKSRSFFAQEYFRNPIVLWLLALSLLINIISIVILAIFVKPVDFPIILHYNVYFGVDVLDGWEKVYLMPAIGIFLLLVNTFLGLYFFNCKERIAGHILMIANLMIQLSLLVASISIILINY